MSPCRASSLHLSLRSKLFIAGKSIHTYDPTFNSLAHPEPARFKPSEYTRLFYNPEHLKECAAYTAIMTSTIGIPIKLLNEAQGHIVTLEITSGQTYRGKLLEAEDNMNVQLKDITVTARDGRVSHLDQVYIRGSHVRFFIVPDMLKNAPMFRSRNARGRGVGLARGRATVSRARASGRGGR
ncbi:hypothetical protein F5B22DRAFT_590182 [Xylaria bambusicola]|nr:uncharacterized protein F5B22DRAFT_590182 [Xylaria bambusicola]KAI0525497.1 hypothetical protein F5B22DRAFT_590182 [Xylaria bambusicola]